MAVFSAAMLRSFEQPMLALFRADSSAATESTSDDEILRMITMGIELAARYDIVGEADVERYLRYMFIYGPDFDTDVETARIGEILRAEVNASKKMDRIDEYHRLVTKQPQS